ncbi:DUF6461 domain-containing protein [Actinoplanes sp. M2I2]|uniref:DUF6461 domain-containing protein n=1 Tax=Actinoplanes sp. M2I2 TaxID=1734444 RepID=UPI002020718C|nr:DUF6461 domain-containing protein [Actinoplanes sp. M2I2]
MAGDYAWFREVTDLSKGFCFVWVRRVRPAQVLDRMGAKELERIGWQQMVGAGDGQRGFPDKCYFGVTRLNDDWALVVEDNGELGTEDGQFRALSAGTTLICLYRADDGSGRFLLMEDRGVTLQFDPVSGERPSGRRAAELETTVKATRAGAPAQPDDRMAAAFALAERLTGVPLTQADLRKHTYLFSVVPTGQ